MGEQFNHEPLKLWLDFAQKTLTEFPDEYEPALLELAERLSVSPLPLELHPSEYATFDELTYIIYASVIDGWISKEWLPPEATQGNLSYRWYYNAFKKIEHYLPPHLLRLMRYPLIGRPIWRNEDKFPYITEYDFCLTAYWTAEEVQLIQKEWPFPDEARHSLYALQEALAHAAAEGKGLSMLCT